MRNTLLYTLLFALYLVLFTACDRKTDENGDLDGMWQLTEWRNKTTNQVLKTQQDGIYYCVQLNLIKYQIGGQGSYYHFSYFTQTPDSLIVGRAFAWPGDKECPLDELTPYGVPHNGRFHIDVLNADKMVLSGELSTLYFRKY